jgi:hypothetical protein
MIKTCILWTIVNDYVFNMVELKGHGIDYPFITHVISHISMPLSKTMAKDHILLLVLHHLPY